MRKAIPILFLAAALQAHEIGTTRVTAIFNGGAYTIDVVTDANTLLEKLEAVSGLPPTGEPHPDRIQNRLSAFDEKFRQRLSIQFDKADVRPEISYVVEPGTPDSPAAGANIRLTGQIPAGARLFGWRYAWTFASYSLTVRNAGAPNATTVWLEGGQTSPPLDMTALPVATRLDTALRYLSLGFTHILPHGLDHMLFVLGIYLLTRRARSVLLQVSAFTIAHSITLGLSMYGIVSVRPAVVEPLIAVSIAYVAIENIFLSELKSWRVVLIFAFGLLHGLGFAGALREVGLPASEFATALLTFNIGVEAGQLAVIAAAFILFGWHWSNRVWYRARVVVPMSALIACTAVYWTVERLSL